MKERRKAKRIKKADKATIVLNSDVGDQRIKKIYHILTKDLSIKGIKIPIDTFIPVDTRLKIEIFIENPPSLIFTNGKIRWIKCLNSQELYETGIEFVDLTPDKAKILEKHIHAEK